MPRCSSPTPITSGRLSGANGGAPTRWSEPHPTYVFPAPHVTLTPIKEQVALREKSQMAKNKQQKKKERERRVAQKKHAAAQKRDQAETASEKSKAGRKTNIFTASVAVPKTSSPSTNTKQSFSYRRSGG
jgi:hypothetical protein